MPNPITLENQRPGSTSWRLDNPASPDELQAFVRPIAAQAGDTIELFVDAATATINVELFRMGWYGGSGARLVASVDGIPALRQPAPSFEPARRTFSCAWQATWTFAVDDDSLSGAYLVKVSALIDNRPKSTYAFFVVRDIGSSARFLFQHALTTYQAYNGWGGYSLYGGPGANLEEQTANRARAVSFDRPFDAGGGSGQFFFWEYPMLRWLEREGYDVTYATSLDLHRHASWVARHKVVLSVGHDEYWSWEMRDAVERALAGGSSLLFLGANAVYWQIRLESGLVVCHKDDAPAEDPAPLERRTQRWRDLGNAEQRLLGLMWESWFSARNYDWCAARTDLWPFVGTGVSGGDRFAGLLGYECDRQFEKDPRPQGVRAIGASPYLGEPDKGGIQPPYRSDSVYHTSQGALVFSAGTCGWSWGLEDGDWPGLGADWNTVHHVSDPRFRLLTKNILNEAELTGGRFVIADLSGGPDATRCVVSATYGAATFLDGWLDPEDLQLVGDFMAQGHDQVLYLNTDGALGRVMIVDFAGGRPQALFLESWGDSTLLNGWHDPEDLQLVGDFMGLGHDQVLFVNTSGALGRVLIVDFAGGRPQALFQENWGDSTLLNGWHDPEDLQLVGDFMGLGHDQVLFVNTDGALGRVLIVDFAGGLPQVLFQENWGDSTLLNGWHDPEDLQLVGDFMGLGHDQVLFVNTDGALGRVLIVDFAGGQPQAIFLENWGDSTLLNGWHDPEDLQLVGDFMGLGHDQVLLGNRAEGSSIAVATFAGGNTAFAFLDDRLGEPWSRWWLAHPARAVSGKFEPGKSDAIAFFRN